MMPLMCLACSILDLLICPGESMFRVVLCCAVKHCLNCECVAKCVGAVRVRLIGGWILDTSGGS